MVGRSEMVRDEGGGSIYAFPRWGSEWLVEVKWSETGGEGVFMRFPDLGDLAWHTCAKPPMELISLTHRPFTSISLFLGG